MHVCIYANIRTNIHTNKEEGDEVGGAK